MGFIRANTIPLLKEGRRKSFKGMSLLILGYGDIYFDLLHLQRMAKISGFSLDMTVEVSRAKMPRLAENGFMDCHSFFKMLGFASIDILDYSNFEGANLIFDLNNPNLPESLIEQYDMVIDHGTLEHVFHLPNALNNIYGLLKLNGRVMFISPSGNYFDHGFYMLQPTLFLDWLTCNKWEIQAIQVAQLTPNQETEPCFFAEYEPGLFSSVSYGKMDNKLYLTVSNATKLAETTGNKVPQQGVYASSTSWIEGKT